MIEEKQWLMAQVARMYYLDELTQEAIAHKLHFSRSTVSRLLMDARREGIVKIEINFPWQQDSRLEFAICAQFHLADCRVLVSTGMSEAEIVAGTGVLGARALQQALQPGFTIAVDLSDSAHEVIRALEPAHSLRCKAVQLMGVTGADNHTMDGVEPVRLLADRLGGRCDTLQPPLFNEQQENRRNTMPTPAVRRTLELASRAQIALVGIHAVSPSNAGQSKTGAVGELAASFYNLLGEPVRHNQNGRTVSIGLERLKAIPRVIGVASGADKASAVLAALRGGLLDVLITDSAAAQAVLELAGSPADSNTTAPGA